MPSISNNELILSANNRYFLHTPIQCTDENGKLQSQSILIDNISDNSLWNMNTEKLKCSLLDTTTNQMSSEKQGTPLSSGDTQKCRSVSVYADADQQKVISGHISLDDYKNVNPIAVLNTPGQRPSKSPVISPVLSPGPTPGPIPTPGATPAPTQNLGSALNNYLNPMPSPGPSPGALSAENFETLMNEPDLIHSNVFHKIRNNSVLRFYFISLFIIIVYILHRMCKKIWV